MNLVERLSVRSVVRGPWIPGVTTLPSPLYNLTQRISCDWGSTSAKIEIAPEKPESSSSER
jgi:hypothetical protein